MADGKIIKAKLRRLLQVSDMQSATQRSITSMLEEQLDIGPLEEYKSLIKAEIDAYLVELEGGESEEGGSDGEYAPGADADSDFEAAPAGPAKKKQKAAAGAASAAAPAAAAVAAASPADAEFCVALSARRFLSLRRFKRNLFVDAREFYDKDGALAPGAKGLSMPPEQWATLAAHLAALTAALEAKDDSFSVELSSTRRAGVSGFGGRYNADLREWYEAGGERKPGKKGISLPPDQWAKLCEAAPQVTAQLEAKLGAPLPQPFAAAPPGAAHAQAGPSGTAGAGAPAPAAAPAASLPPGVVSLGGTRRAEARSFKGRPQVDLREYYEKGGELLPGKKGISLGAEQWRVLCERAADLSAALSGEDASLLVELSDTRRARVSAFKGRYSVDVREWYTDASGELKPGSKGLSLGVEAWRALCQGMGELTAAVAALGS